MSKLTHFDDEGAARMVDVSDKAETLREALAEGQVLMMPETLTLILGQTIAKGDVFGVARVAGIMAAKKTADLIPLCHPLSLSSIDIAFEPDKASSCVTIRASVRSTGKTGVEMEALTAVAVACLTIYDMCKAIDKSIELGPFYLLEKSGGKSGLFRRKDEKSTGQASR